MIILLGGVYVCYRKRPDETKFRGWKVVDSFFLSLPLSFVSFGLSVIWSFFPFFLYFSMVAKEIGTCGGDSDVHYDASPGNRRTTVKCVCFGQGPHKQETPQAENRAITVTDGGGVGASMKGCMAFVLLPLVALEPA